MAELPAPPPPSPADAALGRRLAELGASVAALREGPMRRAVVCEAVRAMAPDALVGLLALLLERVRDGDGDARAVLQQLALEPTVFEELPYADVQAAYAAAHARGLSAVARLFLGSPPVEPLVEEAARNQHLDLPLGNRRALARGRDRNTLDRLLHDRDHRVVQLLLDNPRLVERDVVRIAAMRPTRPEVLEVVARHPRWSARYAVRKALACNPWTPPALSRRLLPTLLRQDLRLALEAGVLDPEMAAEARALLGQAPRDPLGAGADGGRPADGEADGGTPFGDAADGEAPDGDAPVRDVP